MKVGDLVACERTLNVGKITEVRDFMPDSRGRPRWVDYVVRWTNGEIGLYRAEQLWKIQPTRRKIKIAKTRSSGGRMNVGDLVKDIILDKLGIVVGFHWQDDEDEVYAIVLLNDNSKVLCSYEDMELIACSL